MTVRTICPDCNTHYNLGERHACAYQRPNPETSQQRQTATRVEKTQMGEEATRTTEELLAERAKTHGDFTIHASLTQGMKAVAGSQIGGYDRMKPTHREAIDMILHKIGRILAGNPDFKDHWDDIAGYAKLVADRCK